MTIDLCSNVWITMSETTIKYPPPPARRLYRDYPIGYSGVIPKRKPPLCVLCNDVIIYLFIHFLKLFLVINDDLFINFFFFIE